MAENWQRGGFGLYVHWPFCAAKCPYCDFNSHVTASVDHAAWEAAFLEELDRWGALTEGRVLGSIFFGGGTPSLMPPALVEAIIRRASDHWTFANDIEVTLEANPTSVEAGKFRAFRAAGVNRVSIGLQALNDPDLKALGRLHTVAEGLAALATAQEVFDRVSFDLIYGRQHQSLDDWHDELSQALSLGTDHLSLYQLTIEDGTAFGDRHRRGGLRGLPNEDLGADLFNVTRELCEAAGLAAYETSNHARAGHACRHNLTYWRMGDYVGIGPGAHGRVSLGSRRIASSTVLQPTAWLAAVVGDSGDTQEDQAVLSVRDQALEYVMMALRLSEGLDLEVVNALDSSVLDGDAVRQLAADGFLVETASALALTSQGRPVLNAVLRELIAN